jgi:Redoxin
MDQFGSLKPAIESRGSIVYIAAQKRSSLLHMPDGDPVAYLAKHPTPFPYLLDEDRSLTRAYGVYERLSLDSINIARSATIVVRPDAVIRYIYVGASQHDRAPVEEVLAQL